MMKQTQNQELYSMPMQNRWFTLTEWLFIRRSVPYIIIIQCSFTFQSKQYCCSWDLEKTFLQNSLHPEDRDVVIFLWFKNNNDIDFNNFNENEFMEFRFTRILFGLAPTPFLLSATLLNTWVSSFIKEEPIFVETLLNHFTLMM